MLAKYKMNARLGKMILWFMQTLRCWLKATNNNNLKALADYFSL